MSFLVVACFAADNLNVAVTLCQLLQNMRQRNTRLVLEVADLKKKALKMRKMSLFLNVLSYLGWYTFPALFNSLDTLFILRNSTILKIINRTLHHFIADKSFVIESF